MTRNWGGVDCDLWKEQGVMLCVLYVIFVAFLSTSHVILRKRCKGRFLPEFPDISWGFVVWPLDKVLEHDGKEKGQYFANVLCVLMKPLHHFPKLLLWLVWFSSPDIGWSSGEAQHLLSDIPATNVRDLKFFLQSSACLDSLLSIKERTTPASPENLLPWLVWLGVGVLVSSWNIYGLCPACQEPAHIRVYSQDFLSKDW